ncbi:MAG TPA: DUF3857 domain-containing protein [Pedobacter sp.]|nr:DUF3857 domain-containing protein [Pedobacter sp.]
MMVFAQGKNFSVDRTLPSWIVKVKTTGARPHDKDISDGYFLSFYENQTHAELQEEYAHTVREIISDAGVQNGSQISITYDPSFQKLIFHKILLWRNNKSADQLNEARFKVLQNEKDLSKFIYSGTYDAFLLLEDVRKGDKIEFAYTIKGNNPIFGNKFASQFYFEGSSSIGQLYTSLIVNKDRNVNIKNFNDTQSPKISIRDGFKLYEWESKLTKTHRIADFEPSWYNPLKRVQLTEYSRWNEVVNWGLSVNAYPDLISPLLNQKIAELKKLSGSDKIKYIELATRFVQDEIRYMGIEMGVYSHRPNSPEKVLKQRYGDCKDKSLLLVHLLSAMDIKAYMAYTDTETTIKTNDLLPSPFIFNHVIVAIDHENRKIWIDPTISFQRGKFIDFYTPDYGYALVLKPGINELEKISSVPKGKLVAKLVFNIADTASDKKSSLAIKTTYTGNYADDIRSAIAESGTDGLEKDYLEYYGKFYTDIESKAPIRVTDNEEKNKIELTESYEIENIWVKDTDGNGNHHVYLYGDLIGNELRKIKAKKRLEPLSLKHPVNVEQEITMNFPYNYNDDPEVITVKNDKYFFELHRFSKGKIAKYNYTFRSMKSYIDGSEIKKYVKDYKKIDEHLTYYYTAEGGSTEEPINTNPYTIMVLLLAGIMSSIFFLKIYQKRTPFEIEEIASAKPIGGWLIFFAIRVLLGPIAIISKMSLLGFFDSDFWTQLDNLDKIKGIIIRACHIINLVGYSILIPFSVLCLFLFFKRRNSFPGLYIIFTKLIICSTILSSCVSFIGENGMHLYYSIGYQICLVIFSVIISVICIWYLKKSKRVRQTFVFTYPESEWTKAMIRYYNSKLTQKSPGTNESTQENKHENI